MSFGVYGGSHMCPLALESILMVVEQSPDPGISVWADHKFCTGGANLFRRDQNLDWLLETRLDRRPLHGFLDGWKTWIFRNDS